MNQELYNKCIKANFRNILTNKGYAYFTKGSYNLNIIGVRANKDNKVTNEYDDILVVEYKSDDNCAIQKMYSITTEPGRKLMLNPSSAKGTAILVPGQYRSVYQIDLHRGKYKALCQRNGAVLVYRDNNKDLVYDLEPKSIDKGWFGINIHRSDEFKTRNTIDGYSAGCQVFNNPSQFNHFMALCEQAKSIYGNKFTYTLITEDDLV